MLTQHMQAVSKDAHLLVRWYPDPLPEDRGSLLENEDKLTELIQSARSKSYGIEKIERLPGNVGLIEIRYFFNPEWGSVPALTAAMTLLENVQALIFDLRRCQGGNPHMVARVTSYLFEGEPIHLNSMYWRAEDRAETFHTLSDLPGKRIPDIPVFILTSPQTFSAGEEFAYNLQALERATLVGEPTAGGAHPGAPFRIDPHFEAFIPRGRAINPVTGSNWEGVGVQPDIPIPPEQALDTAHKLALEGIITSLETASSRIEVKLLEEAQAALESL
jgi:C-terminal processing protease CtpA/Prc